MRARDVFCLCCALAGCIEVYFRVVALLLLLLPYLVITESQVVQVGVVVHVARAVEGQRVLFRQGGFHHRYVASPSIEDVIDLYVATGLLACHQSVIIGPRLQQGEVLETDTVYS